MKLVAKDVSYSYRIGGRKIIAGLSFTAESGSYWCLAGPNGSGKSTFLRLACGLLPLETLTGELSWDGRPLLEWTRLELARNVSFVGGALRTHFPVSVAEFVLQGRYARSPSFWVHPTAADAEYSAGCIERVGIAALADASIAEISAGESQLAMIARALAQQPRVIILDEATANLDLRYQLRVFELLESLNKEGITIIVVSHDVNVAAEFCPNALWLNDGMVYSQGTMKDTLTPAVMQDLYEVGDRVAIGESPYTKRPKIFWK
ncbi:MAG: ABC transporter ATP-binding protein [Deltaproteobacteria bacterium]|nr:ABC transporter ATP-binding protein [Deltaproteobacteria bacterium]